MHVRTRQLELSLLEDGEDIRLFSSGTQTYVYIEADDPKSEIQKDSDMHSQFDTLGISQRLRH